MADLIQDRKASEKQEQRYDLFSGFLDANDDENLSEAKLTRKELFGVPFHVC
jgi:hypothetical protein